MLGTGEDAIGDAVHLVVLQVDGVNVCELRGASHGVGVEGVAGQSEGGQVGQRTKEAVRQLGDLVAFHIELVQIDALAKRAWNRCQAVVSVGEDITH